MQHGAPRRWTWWRLTLCSVGALLVLGALVGLTVTPATVVGGGTYQVSPNVTIVTTARAVNTAAITWLIVIAAVGVAALIASLVLPRRGTRTPQRER